MKKYIAIHHTAVSRQNTATQLLAVNRYHQQKWNSKSNLGWYVGYNYFIDVSGSLVQTRREDEETIANIGHNCDVASRCDTISVCLAGDFNRELPNDKQIQTLKMFVKQKQSENPGINVTFHRNLQKGRTCPGALFTKEYLDTRILNETNKPDDTDTDKRTIAELQTQLDWILVRLKQLQALFK